MSVPDVPSTSIIIVGQDWRGQWIVQENHGLMGGIFRSRDAAMHFIADERASFPDASIEAVTTTLSLMDMPARDEAA
jgi:hypothetical protein